MAKKNNSEVDDLIKNLSDPMWRICSGKLYKIIIKGDDDSEGLVIPFIPNRAQRRFIKRLHHRNLILKARQLGFTTLISILWLDHAQFNANSRCGIVAQDREAAEAIFRDKVKFAYENQPQAIKDMFPLAKESATEILFAHNNSSIRVATSLRSGTIHRLHVCLSGETKVLLKDGFVKAIKDVEEGDLVMNDKGSYQKVRALVKNKIEDIEHPLISIKTSGYYEPLKATGNHSILTREHATGKPIWKQADEIEVGDYIAYPIREPSNRLRNKSLPIGKQERAIGENGKREKNIGKKIPVDFNLGSLMGFYLAEGTIRRTETTFSIHRDEIEYVLGLIEPYKEFYSSYRIYNRKDSLTSTVTVNGKEFAEFIAKFFGCGENKFIPDAVWNYGREFLDGLVFGYFSGDGSFTSINLVQVTSIRRQLIDQMKMILISLRFGMPSIYHRPAGMYFGRNCKETWVLKLHGSANWKFRKYFDLPLPDVSTKAAQWRIDNGRNPEGRKLWRRGADHYWSRVTSAEIIEDEEFVYDIALENSPHNYVTVNGVVHNSEFGKICRRYPEKAREVITGSIPAVPMSGITIIESTAEGAEGYFHDMVQQALRLKDADKDLTEKDYRIHFYAWWDAPDYIASQEVQDTIFIEPDLHAYFDKIEVDMKTTITLAQRAWYVMTLGSDFNNVRELMYQEYPSTPQEAFHVSAEGLIYSEQMTQMRKQGRILKIPIVNNPVYTFWDIGNTDGTAIWFMQRVGMEDRFIDYWEERDVDYTHVMKVLQDKGYLWAKHYLPHDAGHKRQAIENLSTKEILERLGLRNIEVLDRIDTIQNGINLTKYAFPEIFIDEERCHLGIKRLDNYKKKWNNTLGLYSGEPLHDHNSEGADALRQYAQAKASGLIQSPNSNTFKRKSGSNWRTA